VRQHPRQQARRWSAITAALAAVALVGGAAGPALAAPAASARSAASTASSGWGSSGSGSSVRQLLLITGDRLVVTGTDGRQDIAVRFSSRHEAMTSLKFGGQVMEIPADATPYLGHGLDPRLFDLGALEKAEANGRLPVQVTFAGHQPAIPGLTVTRASAGSAVGYLTAASAARFGAALARQYALDHAGARYGTDGLFGHDVSISLLGSPSLAARPSAAAHPAGYRLRTLTIDATNQAGQPDTGDTVFITDADNYQRFDGLNGTQNFFYDGSTRFSVPAGHFWAIAMFFTGDSLRMVVVPQFTVAGQHTTIHIAEKSASSEVTIATPRKVALDSDNSQETFEVVRGDASGGPYSYSSSWAGLSGWVSPTTRKPTVGTLNAYTSATLASPAAATPGYDYNLDFPAAAGIIPSQHFTVTPASLGTVTERFYQAPRSPDGGWVTFGGTLPQLNFELEEIATVAMPAVMTQYFTAGPAILWSSQTYASLNTFALGDTDAYRDFSGGQQLTEDWNNYPLHPVPAASLGGASSLIPVQTSAARIGNDLSLSLIPFGDNQFGHTGPGFGLNGNATQVGSYTLDQNGTQLSHGSALDGIPTIKLSAAPSVLRLVLNAARWGSAYPLSPSSRTIWTWRSARDTAARVPAGWYCSTYIAADAYRYYRRCVVQPLMTLSYAVAGLSLSGLTKPGAQVVDVTAGHLQVARASAITGATAAVSYNDGESWRAATVTAEGGGRFRLAFSAPAGVDVTLRVNATDAAGGSINETILRAYGVAP
jgi:hypothetical protein